MEEVILVNENDEHIGTMEKLAAHRQGKLHRAISVFIFHPDGRMLLQKRAQDKYHSGGLWTNTCCSHPRPNERTLDAAHRRLQEEMGFDCDLTEVHSFVYKTEFPNGLIEHEYDHVLVGISDQPPVLHPEEADDWKWIELKALQEDIHNHKEHYTYWFRHSLDDVLKKATQEKLFKSTLMR